MNYQSVKSAVSTPEKGGGPVRIEQKRYMSLNEMYGRMYQMGYLADLRARALSNADHNVFMAQRDKLIALVDKGLCPKRPSMVDNMDLVSTARDINDKLERESRRIKLEKVREEASKKKDAFEKAVSDEVTRRVSALASNPNVSGGQ